MAFIPNGPQPLANEPPRSEAITVGGRTYTLTTMTGAILHRWLEIQVACAEEKVRASMVTDKPPEKNEGWGRVTITKEECCESLAALRAACWVLTRMATSAEPEWCSSLTDQEYSVVIETQDRLNRVAQLLEQMNQHDNGNGVFTRTARLMLGMDK